MNVCISALAKDLGKARNTTMKLCEDNNIKMFYERRSNQNALVISEEDANKLKLMTTEEASDHPLVTDRRFLKTEFFPHMELDIWLDLEGI